MWAAQPGHASEVTCGGNKANKKVNKRDALIGRGATRRFNWGIFGAERRKQGAGEGEGLAVSRIHSFTFI